MTNTNVLSDLLQVINSTYPLSNSQTVYLYTEFVLSAFSAFQAQSLVIATLKISETHQK